MKRNPHETRIVITGLGTINPIGNDVPEFWDNLLQGKNGVRTLQFTPMDPEPPVKIGGEVDIPDISQYLPKKMMRRLDRFIVFGHVAGCQAMDDSGITKEMVEKEPDRYGAIIGTGDGGNQGHFKSCRAIDSTGYDFISPFYVIGVIPNTSSAYVAKQYGMQGPNFSVNSACATSNHAIGTAANLIKMGMADVMLAGGAEAVCNQAGVAGFSVIGALSHRNDSPETASRPFDKNRDGFVLGEGAGVVCLEELEHAKKRGAKIYAELTGYGFSCDAYDLVAPHPEGRGAMMAMEKAMEDSGLNKEQISLINAHGTSTPLGDKTESATIRRLFGDLTDTIPVHSTKSMIGHLVGAAGGTEAIAACQAIQQNVAHQSINIEEVDPDIHLNIVKDGPLETKVNHVLSNSFGFGGQNSTIIISRYNG